jgi:hypothetical protein
MPWKEKEIRKYKEVRRRKLEPLYTEKGISADEPEKRAEYLGKEKLGLTEENMKSLGFLGNVESLKTLEEMAVRDLFPI